MTSNTAPYVRVKNISAYIQSLRDRYNTYWIVKGNGEHYYLEGGKEIPGAEFESNNPAPVLQPNRNYNGFQLDGRTNWID